MKRNFRKLKICLLSLVTLFYLSMPMSSNAESFLTLDLKNSNIDLKFTSEYSWEYTQEKDGESYKVVEEAIPGTYDVNSKIYKKDKQGNYVLETEIFTTSKNGEQTLEITENGKQRIETYKIEINNDDIDLSNELNKKKETLTKWQYSNSYGSNYNITSAVVGVVASGLASILGLPPGWAFLVGAATSIITAGFKSVYTYYNKWYKNPVGTTILAGIKKEVTIYETSSKKKIIKGPETHIDCAQGYDCSGP